jgi:hypothetical protein
VTAVEKRQRLGHTTGEREAKGYNGSDWERNIDRLMVENPKLADANEPLDPEQYAPAQNNNNQADGEEEN